MRNRLGLLVLVTAATAALLPATASTETYDVATGVGYRCTANTVVQNETLLVAGEYGSNVMRIAPGGVIVGWGLEVAPGIGPLPQQLVVFKPLGNGAYRKVAESTVETVSAGNNNFDARIPVKGGESVGLFGPHGTLACNETAETRERDKEGEPAKPTDAVSLRSAGSTFTGGTMTFQPQTGIGTPLSTSVDNDEDEDGYGDDDQDRCPGEGSRGHDCPIGVHITRVEVRRRAILLEVTPKAFARIWVRGEFRWRQRPRRPGEQGLLVSVDSNSRRKEVGADKPESFRIRLPDRALRHLNHLPRDKSMLAHIGVYVTDRHGWENEELMHIVLRGRR